MSFFVAIGPAGHAATMTASDDIIQLIKNYEGFRSYVYWNSGSAYIGYGTICKSTDYPNGISEEKADALLREAIKVKEASINKILTKYSIQLTQQEYDAVLDLTYNIGTAWMSSSSRLYTYLANGHQGYADIDIVNAFATWCHVSGDDVSTLLIERRIREAKIFLYADYAGRDTHTYKYLTYDAAGGSVDHSIMFYETGKTYGSLQTATRAGYTLKGWYTSDGEKVSAYSTVTKNHDVAARWIQGDVQVNTGTYIDVKETDWNYNYISDLSARGIISGYPDGTFQPNKTVTCAEALKLILIAVGFDEQTSTGGHWANGYLKLAISKGIVPEGGITNLDANISRRAVAEVAAKAIGLPPLDPEATFADTNDGFVLQLYHCSIITGDNQTGQLLFHPEESITRGQLSAILSRLVNSGIILED